MKQFSFPGFYPNYSMILRPLSILTLLITLSAHAAPPVVDVTGAAKDVYTIRISGLSGASGAEATKTLSNDLERSGCFRVVSDGGEYILEGSASGSSVQCKVLARDGASAASATASGSLRRAVHQVADAIVEKIAKQKGIAQSRIAFVSDKNGKKQIFVMDYDGANVLRFTDDKLAVAPSFNHQGTKLAYTAYRPIYPDVLVMSYPGGSRQAVARFPGLNSGAAFSPDGSKLAIILSKDGNPELYVMSAGGSDSPRRLTRTRGGESSPSWSADGSEIVYSSDEGGRPQIYTIPSSGGTGTRITSSPAYNTSPDWSSESGLITYSSLSGQWAISVLDPKGGGGKVVYSKGSCEDPSWAPDGRHIVFSRRDGGGSELYVLDTKTEEAVQLSNNFGNCTEPSWSGR